MKRQLLFNLLLVSLAVLVVSCDPRMETSGSNDEPSTTSLSGDSGNAPQVDTADRNPAGTGTINAAAEPGGVRGFLDEQQIANGDIYLKDGKVYINIVGLNDEIRQLLADQYAAGTYQLVHVAHSIEELEEAQQKLSDRELYRTLNLYGSNIDVIKNKLIISMPDTSEAKAKPEIERLIDPALITYDIQALSEKAEFVGTIVKIDPSHRQILILEEGKEEPSILFGFGEHSEIVNAQGAPITFEDLKEQQEVRLWSTGMFNDSLPVQTSARRLELIDETTK
ncbi:hypothetical protein [Paenibacillus montanisoli]|uniref:Uncharacterized protein n=1 Tax=Paenibacillus montanisoli TaxID=2081970 RepID=A0A328TZJ2_9BACL|nr:hypothetical protein [Paenibacillus montanisoli]RAP75859.1 hypothetical protein DL346_10515 [Paenibacillus montanisoli]